MKYKLTYKLYDHSYSKPPTEVVVVTEDPFEHIERIKSDLLMVHSDVQLGTYTVEPIKHLKVVK